VVREHTSFHSLETLVNIPRTLVKNICSVVVACSIHVGRLGYGCVTVLLISSISLLTFILLACRVAEGAMVRSLYCKDTSCLTASLSHIKIQTFFWLLLVISLSWKWLTMSHWKWKEKNAPNVGIQEKWKWKEREKICKVKMIEKEEDLNILFSLLSILIFRMSFISIILKSSYLIFNLSI